MNKLTRRQAVAALAAPLAAQQSTRLNFVFILIDDLRYNATGYAGHPFVKTPNIDRIAREGAIFRNAFVTTPLCSPSRASYLTGRYVHSHGVTGNGDNAALSHKLVTVAMHLQGAGYETGFFGKWHMGTDDSPRPGWDRWVSFKGQGVYNDPPVNIDGKQVKADGYITDILTGHAEDFLKKPRSKPFLIHNLGSLLIDHWLFGTDKAISNYDHQTSRSRFAFWNRSHSVEQSTWKLRLR